MSTFARLLLTERIPFFSRVSAGGDQPTSTLTFCRCTTCRLAAFPIQSSRSTAYLHTSASPLLVLCSFMCLPRPLRAHIRVLALVIYSEPN